MARYEPRPGLTDRERLAVIEQMLGDFIVELRGNGQPGIIAKIEERQEKVEVRLEERSQKLEARVTEAESWIENAMGSITTLKWIGGMALPTAIGALVKACWK